eukprot:g50397.t1
MRLQQLQIVTQLTSFVHLPPSPLTLHLLRSLLLISRFRPSSSSSLLLDDSGSQDHFRWPHPLRGSLFRRELHTTKFGNVFTFNRIPPSGYYLRSYRQGVIPESTIPFFIKYF